ncbi:hypothetical protein AXG93_2817s1320 [Marchantia polymorpha subsp. ruderalis]|uniref:Uncharacterized protein n=1 Tax=Marchantia polymorpha subsp. ruderalis TaxID=1480154 RepID=A0A176W2P3_MARPO|nr:hypothetical protein AXG93_2817s1320 [Marchantia polymorpha subsp. ruderalis]
MKFLLKREIVKSEYESVMGGNKIVSEDDDVQPAQPSAEINILDNDNVEKPTAKRRRRVVTPLAPEDVVTRSRLRTRRNAPARLRLAKTHARMKWDVGTKDEWPLEWRPSDVPKEKPLEEGKEGEDETETETSGQRLRTSEQPEPTLKEDLWTSDVRERMEKFLEVLPLEQLRRRL